MAEMSPLVGVLILGVREARSVSIRKLGDLGGDRLYSLRRWD
jgi:hypothetical protein